MSKTPVMDGLPGGPPPGSFVNQQPNQYRFRGLRHERPGARRRQTQPTMSTTFDRERGFRGQALKEIVVRIGSTDTLVVQSAAVDLAIMAQFSEYNRTQMVEHGAIEQIVTMLLKPSSHSAETIGHALMGLTVLCQGGYPDVEHVSPAAVRAAIVEAGGVRCLVALLNDCGTRLNSMGTIPRESLDQLRVYAKVAGAIVTLCEESEPNARAFAQAGAIKPLLALLGCTMRVPQRLLSPLEPDISDPNAAGARAAAAVSALACNEELQRRLVDEGAFAPLCGLCTISPNAICREECAKALFKLVIGSIHNKIELCTLGGVECLIGLLISARTPKVRLAPPPCPPPWMRLLPARHTGRASSLPATLDA